MSDYDSDAVAGFDQFFGDILAGLTPAKRKASSRKLGQALRRANLARITKNVQPDGTAMEPRRPKKDARGQLRKAKGGKMFRTLRLVRSWRIDAQADSVEIRAVNPLVGNTARIHHSGLRGFVGRDGAGKVVRAKYAERRLLGFAPDDEKLALAVAEKLLIAPDA